MSRLLAKENPLEERFDAQEPREAAGWIVVQRAFERRIGVRLHDARFPQTVTAVKFSTMSIA
jgi:hypothetical protein